MNSNKKLAGVMLAMFVLASFFVIAAYDNLTMESFFRGVVVAVVISLFGVGFYFYRLNQE